MSNLKEINILTVPSPSLAGLNYQLAIRPIIDSFPADPAIYILMDKMGPAEYSLGAAYAADNLDEAITEFRGDYANASALTRYVGFIAGPGSTKELRQYLAEDLNKTARIALLA